MDSLPDLRVPYGFSESGVLVSVENAVRGERFTCPGCAAILVLRDGPAKKRRKHFAHPSHGACSQESIFHATAKRLIADAIREHVSGKGEGIALRLNCSSCTVPINYPIPRDKFTDAVEEHSIDGYRCDVVGLKGSEVLLAIEVMHTHKTTDAKAAGLSMPMVELEAFDVLSNPCRWIPVRHTMNRIRCGKCKALAANPVVPAAVPAFRPTYRPPPRRAAPPAPRPAPPPKPQPPAPSTNTLGPAARYFVRRTATLSPFEKQLERELQQYLRMGGRGNRRRQRRF
jgi:hypothetical protein